MNLKEALTFLSLSNPVRLYYIVTSHLFIVTWHIVGQPKAEGGAAQWGVVTPEAAATRAAGWSTESAEAPAQRRGQVLRVSWPVTRVSTLSTLQHQYLIYLSLQPMSHSSISPSFTAAYVSSIYPSFTAAYASSLYLRYSLRAMSHSSISPSFTAAYVSSPLFSVTHCNLCDALSKIFLACLIWWLALLWLERYHRKYTYMYVWNSEIIPYLGIPYLGIPY